MVRVSCVYVKSLLYALFIMFDIVCGLVVSIM